MPCLSWIRDDAAITKGPMIVREKSPVNPDFGRVESARVSGQPVGRLIFLMALSAVVAIVICRAFVFQTFKIPSGSMTPTLLIGDHIVVNKFIFGTSLPGRPARLWRMRLPQRGDVIVFYRFSEFEDLNSTMHYIKRIVAIPGDTVEVRNFRTFINGEGVGRETDTFSGPETDSTAGRNYGPIKLGDGQYFVLGDNQANSRDSRYYGPVSIGDIEGLARIIYWSWKFENGSASVRWNRVGTVIQ